MTISLHDVGLTYPNGVRALDGIDLTLKAGEFVALVGASGCGKSSLLKLLAGLAAPSRGNIENPADNIGFVFQEPTLLAWRSVRHNVALPLALAGTPRREKEERVAAALEAVGLETRADALPHELSGGMKMRTALARALVAEPRLLLMDEPFAALDELTRFRLEDDLRRIWQTRKCTVVFVTHSVTESVYLAERILVMSVAPGQLVSDIPIDTTAHTGGDFRRHPAFYDSCTQVAARLAENAPARAS